MDKDKDNTHFTAEQLFKMLKKADLPEEKKRKIEKQIIMADGLNDQDMLDVIGPGLKIKRESDYVGLEKMENEQSELKFYTNSNVLLVGPPGCGKTMLLCHELMRVSKEEPETTVFFPDTEGDASRILPSMIPPGKLLVIPSDLDKRNLLENYHISRGWLGNFPKPFAETSYIGDAGFIMLSSIARYLTRPDQIKHMGGNATMQDVLEAFDSDEIVIDEHKIKEYGSGNKFRFSHYNDSSGPIFYNRKGHDPSFFDGKIVVYNYSNLSSSSQLFMMAWMMTDLYFKAHHNIYKNKVILVLEEIHRIYRSLMLRQNSLFEPVLEDLHRSGRKRKLFGWDTDHTVKNQPDVLLDTSDTKAFFRQTQAEDKTLVEKAVCLHPDLTAQLSAMPNRECIFFVGGQMKTPEYHRVPDIEFTEYSDDEVREMMLPHIRKIPFVPVREDSKPSGRVAANDFVMKHKKQVKIYLAAVGMNPHKPVQVVSRPLKFTVDDKFREKVAQANLTTYPLKHNFGMSGSHYNDVYVELTASGAAFIDKPMDQVVLPRGKNKTLLSRIAVFSIYMHLKNAGRRVRLEHKGIMDVAEFSGQRIFACEYESEVHPHIVDSYALDFKHGADKIFMVMDKKVDLDKAMRMLKADLPKDQYDRITPVKTEVYMKEE